MHSKIHAPILPTLDWSFLMQTVTAPHTVPILGAPMRFGLAAARAFAYARRVTLGHALVSAA
jgi:hypothetical protein